MGIMKIAIVLVVLAVISLGFSGVYAQTGQECGRVGNPSIAHQFVDVDEIGNTIMLIDIVQHDENCIQSSLLHLPTKYIVKLIDSDFDFVIDSIDLIGDGELGFTLAYGNSHVEIPYCIDVTSYWTDDSESVILNTVYCI